ncbi:MAG: NAD(P)/FAD-dependent oxidoreductase [Alphaproteobacteria bacterium]|nr:NAD(P)/FAD-dependent oxidoreductase [Alphaproteobacteria bacterium]
MIDLLVAGAGPAGWTAAIAAATRGLEVVVVEPREGTLDKACGEGLMPATVEALARLGVHPHGRPFHGIRYLADGVEARGRFATPALGVRRTRLHEALEARATALGVRRVEGRVRDPRQDADGVRAAGLRARWMIAADGLHSPTRRALGLDRPVRAPLRRGLRRHVVCAPWASTVDVHWGDDLEAYVTPVDEELVGVALLYGETARRRGGDGPSFDRLLGTFPALEAHLRDAPSGSAPRGAGPFQARSRQRVAGRILLVGDAAGYVDALTGEGTKLAVLGAIAAVDALGSGRPEAWERSWRRLWLPYWGATTGLLALSRPPALRRALPRVLRRAPWLFDAALRVLAR